jgi:DNA-binding beta-propeller fold protein YncE
VAIDPVTHLAAVAVQSPDRLVLVDDRSGRVVREVPLPGSARHVSLARPGGPFLVPAETANQLVEVDPRTGRTRSTPVGDHPHDATAVGPRIFTADEFGATMTVVRDGRVVGTMPVDVQPGGIAAAGDRVAIVSVRAYDVELYDGRSDRPRGLGAQSGGLGPSHVVVGPDGRLVIAETLQICRTTDPPTIVLLAMPITSDEATFVARSGWRCFEERLASSSVNVFDSGRASVDGLG